MTFEDDELTLCVAPPRRTNRHRVFGCTLMLVGVLAVAIGAATMPALGALTEIMATIGCWSVAVGMLVVARKTFATND